MHTSISIQNVTETKHTHLMKSKVGTLAQLQPSAKKKRKEVTKKSDEPYPDFQTYKQ